ncbi:hypothetical protein B0J13DRAFT_651877 [Dactylonectria estremocensis]|uniref:Uncharacterized protein n=1 Tax=Dactylonectria estremocensis TaxID=1079267 RepID=A0A9P9DHC7_9HYPO|nr:hypothetical protein B0J13DRAFT_651877 [Dactylonectria estremocensis]
MADSRRIEYEHTMRLSRTAPRFQCNPPFNASFRGYTETTPSRISIMASQLVAAWQPTIDSFWDRYFKFNTSLSEAVQAMERGNLALILTLTGQGQIEEAIIECGRMWRRENERTAPMLKYAISGWDNHPVIWVLSRIYGSVKYPDLWETCGNYCINPAFLIVQGMARDLPTDRHALLEAFVSITLYWLSVKNNLMLTEATKFGMRLLSQLETIPDFDSHVTVLLRNSLAIAFLQGHCDYGMGHPGIDSDPGWNTTWTQRETIIRAFLGTRNEGRSALDGETQRLFYSFINVSLSHQLDDSKAVHDLMQLYRDRGAIYDERHDTSISFITELLGEFVQLQRKTRVFLATHEEHGFMYDLVDFCLANEKYDHAQVLVQEFMAVPGRVIPTDSSTCREVFSKWRAPIRSVQALLAQDGAPGTDYYWEDSRLYTMSLRKIETSPAYIGDLFPKAPIKVTATPEAGLQLEISNECLNDWRGRSDSQSLHEVTQQVKRSEIWYLLQKLDMAKDWRILRGLDDQSHHPMCQRGHICSDNLSLCKDDMYGKSHVFWIFEEELIEATMADGQDAREVYTHVYRFLNVGDFGTPSWMALKFPQMNDEDGNQPSSTCQHGTYYYPRKQSYGYKGNMQRDQDDEILRMQCAISDESGIENGTGVNPTIKLTVPVIPYDHFERSRSYRCGMKYSEYLDMLKGSLLGDQQFSDGILHMQKAILYSEPKPVLPVWDLVQPEKTTDNIKAEDLGLSFTQGFLNGILTGAVVLDTTGSEHSYGLVSTAWRDWKTYILHPVPSNVLTTAKLSNIESSNVLGYIIGSWTTHDLSQQAAGIRLLVVEAELRFRGERVNFAMNACLYPGNSKTLSSYEQRIFCGRLNPTLFRYAPTCNRGPAFITYSKRLKRKRKLDFQFLHPSQDEGSTDSPTEPYSSDEFWDEMMAREVWDRVVKKQQGVKAPDPRAEEYTRWREGEEQRRREWDSARGINQVVFLKADVLRIIETDNASPKCRDPYLLGRSEA